MVLGELLDVTCCAVNIRIVDRDGSEMARYDGRDSIPLEFNALKVLLVEVDTRGLVVTVD